MEVGNSNEGLLCMLSHIVLLCCNETTGMKDVNDNVVLCLILEVLSQ